MASNPFEPPRTTDLEGRPATAQGPRFLSAEATQELAAAARGVRWLARVTSAAIALGIVKTIVNIGKQGNTSRKAGLLLTMVVVTAISVMILRVLRRYAAAADRLRAGVQGSAGEVIAAQASYFKLLGVLLITGMGLVALLLLLALVGLALSR